MSDVFPWLIFTAGALAIMVTGWRLAREGDRLGDETGLGGAWIGVVLLASATSLPEVFTSVSAAIVKEPDLAAGNLFGSSMANMLILAIVDLTHRRVRVLRTVSQGHTLVASLSVVLTAFAAAMIMSRVGLSVAAVGVDTVILAVVYMLGTRVVFIHEYVRALARMADTVAEQEGAPPQKRGLHWPSRRTVLSFGAATAVVMVAAPLLATSAQDITDQTGLEASFVGVVMLAVATSLPELATSLSAARMGAFDLSVGNLFGSNAFNMFAFVFVDIAYRPGPIFESVSSAEVVAALFAVLLTSIAVMGLTYRVERRYWGIEPDSAVIIFSYFAGLFLVYEATR